MGHVHHIFNVLKRNAVKLSCFDIQLADVIFHDKPGLIFIAVAGSTYSPIDQSLFFQFMFRLIWKGLTDSDVRFPHFLCGFNQHAPPRVQRNVRNPSRYFTCKPHMRSSGDQFCTFKPCMHNPKNTLFLQQSQTLHHPQVGNPVRSCCIPCRCLHTFRRGHHNNSILVTNIKTISLEIYRC